MTSARSIRRSVTRIDKGRLRWLKVDSQIEVFGVLAGALVLQHSFALASDEALAAASMACLLQLSLLKLSFSVLLKLFVRVLHIRYAAGCWLRFYNELMLLIFISDAVGC